MGDLDKSLFIVENLTKDNLREFSLSRAKYWTKLMNEMSKDDSEETVHIDNIDELFTSADEEQESFSGECELESADEHVECGEDDSVVNISAIEQNLTISNAQNILAVIAQNPDTTGIVDEDREFLEKTLPIFESYNREVRADGFEKLLDTFDERRIEKNAGKMLRPKITHKISSYQNRPCRYAGADIDTDSDSIDEARYIRSTRKQRGQRFEVTKIIKSYSIEIRRKKLHEKHCYEMPNKTMKELKHPPTTQLRVPKNSVYESLQSCCHRSVDEGHFAQGSQYHQTMHCDSSFSSIDSLDENEGEHCSRSKRHYIDKIKNRTMPCFCRHDCSTMLSQHTRHHSFKHNLPKCHCCQYTLPLVRESECRCRGVDKLCNRVRHLANSSSDDWLVENYDDDDEKPAEKTKSIVDTKSAEESLRSRNWQCHNFSKQSKLSSISEQKSTCSESEEKVKQNTEITKTNTKLQKQAAEPKISAQSIKNVASKESKKSKSSSIKKEPAHEGISSNSDQDSSFERQLQMAIKASKDLYKEELKNRLKKTEESHSKQSTLIKKEVPRKAVKKNVSFQDEHETANTKKQAAIKKKQNFAPKLADISSENESKENINQKASANAKETVSKHNIIKPLNSVESEENKKTKHGDKTKALNTSTTRKLKSNNEVQNKKKVTKTKYPESSNSADSEESLKPKYNKRSSSQTIHDKRETLMDIENFKLTGNSTCSNLTLRKLRICEDTSSDSTEANETVKIRKKTTNNNATVTENTTFFSNPGEICNSTALISPTAKSRQLLPAAIKRTNTFTNATKTVKTNREDDELPSTSTTAKNPVRVKKSVKQTFFSSTDSSDYKRVTSTSNFARIVLYTPNDTTLVPESSFVNGKYCLTLEHLGSVIGKKYAEVFFRYYRGKREFSLSSTVIYIPPRRGYYSGNDTSEDDIDMFDTPDIGEIIEDRN